MVGEMIVEVEKHTSCACGCKIKADVNYSSGLCCTIDKFSFFSLVDFYSIATLSNIINQASADVNAWIRMRFAFLSFLSFLVIFPDFLFRNHCARLVLMIDFGTLINVNADAKMKSTVRLAWLSILKVAGNQIMFICIPIS